MVDDGEVNMEGYEEELPGEDAYEPPEPPPSPDHPRLTVGKKALDHPALPEMPSAKVDVMAVATVEAPPVNALPAQLPLRGEPVELSFTPDEVAQIRAKPKEEKQKIVAECLVMGWPKYKAAELVGVHPSALSQWFRRDKAEMREAMKEAASARAIFEVPNNLRRLIELRDWAENDETKRKAIQDLQRIAGLPIDASPGAGAATSFTIQGGKTQINIGTPELEEKILRLAGLLGTEEARRMVAEELGKHAAADLPGSGAAGDSGGARRPLPGTAPA